MVRGKCWSLYCQFVKMNVHCFVVLCQLRNITSCSLQRRRRPRRRKRISLQQRKKLRRSRNQRPNQKKRMQMRRMNQPLGNQSSKILTSAYPRGEQHQLAVFDTLLLSLSLSLSHPHTHLIVNVAPLIWMLSSVHTLMKTQQQRLFHSSGRTLIRRAGVFGRPRTITTVT